MNIEDIRYIFTIAQQGSFCRAAEILMIAQPALSKRVKKIEQSYNITIFSRSMGSHLTITEDGYIFLEMAEKVLEAHDQFEKKIENIRAREKNCILFGITGRWAEKIVLPLLQNMQGESSQYLINIQTGNSSQLESSVANSYLDVAVVNSISHQSNLYYGLIEKNSLVIYLRANSPAIKKARHDSEFSYPILRLEDLIDEPFVTNSVGSSSYAYLELLQKKNHVTLKLQELINYQNRIAFVNTGRASYMLPLNLKSIPAGFRTEQLFLLEPSQNIKIESALVCRQGFQKTQIYSILYRYICEICS